MEFYGTRKRTGLVRVTPLVRAHVHPRCNHWQPSGETEEFPNLIVDTGHDLLARALQSGNVNTQITYIALGSGAAAPAASDSTLGNEGFRRTVTDYTLTATAGQIITTSYIAPDEANDFNIEEIGWFAEDATAAPDSGTLVARVNYQLPSGPRQKLNTEALQIDRTDTFS